MENQNKNQKQIIIKVLLLVLILLIGALVIYNYKIKKPSGDLSLTSQENQNLLSLKEIKVPEKNEQLNDKNVAIPQEVIQAAPQVDSKLRIFEIKGENKKILPNEFRAYQNDILSIKLTAVDQNYDFYLEGYNLEIQAKKGETKIIEFQALNIGQYNFFCFLCSSKDKPAGKVIIVPR